MRRIEQQPMTVPQLRKNIRTLAITEVVLGVLCTVLGIIEFAINGYVLLTLYLTLGEGIPIVIAGSFGIAAGNENAKTAIIKCHLAFGLIAGPISFVLGFARLPLSIVFGLTKGATLVIPALNFFLSFIVGTMLIKSADFCGLLTGTCMPSHRMQAIQQPVFVQTVAPVQGTNQMYPPFAPGQYPVNPTSQNPPQYQNLTPQILQQY